MLRLILPLVLGVLVGLTGCRENLLRGERDKAEPDKPAPGKPEPGKPDPALPPVEWSADMQAVADGNNQFALDLYAKLAADEDHKGKNVFFSPYSAHTALAMTATGAKGDTRDQMVKVLHLPADEQKAAASGDLGRFYAQPRKDYELSVANALWGQKGYPWRPGVPRSPEEAVRRRLPRGRLHQRPGRRAEADQQVGRGADPRQDQGTDPRRSDQPGLPGWCWPTPSTSRGSGQEKFDPKQTRKLPFTLADGKTTDVPMMHREGGFKWHFELGGGDFRRPEFQLAELPYKGGELSMVVLLPGKHDGLPALEAKLSAEALAGWLAKAQDARRAGPRPAEVPDRNRRHDPEGAAPEARDESRRSTRARRTSPGCTRATSSCT